METIRLNRLRCFGHVQRMEENRIPRNRWQEEVREIGRLVGRKGWRERVYNREKWKSF